MTTAQAPFAAQSTAQPPLRIDFVSDIACPWCAVGAHALLGALQEVWGQAWPQHVQWHLQPFELNPDMGSEGADTRQYLKNKYGMDDAQLNGNIARIAERGAAEGFAFVPGGRPRVTNTFAAHRVLHWAATVDTAKALALKLQLLQACHGDGVNPADPDVLAQRASAAGLDGERARAIALSDEFTAEVRHAQAQWQGAGISSVPSVVFDQRHLVQGGQPRATFAAALRQLRPAGVGAGVGMEVGA